MLGAALAFAFGGLINFGHVVSALAVSQALHHGAKLLKVDLTVTIRVDIPNRCLEDLPVLVGIVAEDGCHL